MTIYLDVIWALNFLFDTLLLYLTAIILKREIKFFRLFVGGFIGSLIILLSVTPLHTISNHPILKLFFSFLMVLAAFGFKRVKYFFSSLMTLYLVTFVTGGALIGTHNIIQFDITLASNVAIGSIQGFGDPISWLFVFIGFPLAWHFSKSTLEKIEVAKIQYDQIVEVEIEVEGFAMECRGLVDSGNQLYDPLSKMPVMFVSIKQMENIPEVMLQIARNSEAILLGEEALAPEWESKMRIIPYKVVGREHQLILAFKPDKIAINKNKEVFLVEKGLVSFTMQELSSDGAFQCIVHPKMAAGLSHTSKVS